MVAQPVMCPVHGTGDNIQRVSGVVAAGQARGTFSGPTGSVVNVDGKWGTGSGYTTLSGSTISSLAASLAPPEEPKKRAFGWVATLVMGYLWIGTWTMSGVMMIVTIFEVASQQGGLSLWQILGMLGCIVLFFGLDILGVRWYMNKHRRVKREYPAKKLAWDKAMARWNRSYYCFRDDIIFDPDNGESSRPQELSQFLYAHT